MTQQSWNTYRTRFLVRARQLTEPLVFTDLFGREQSGRPGDYLVETSEGIRRIASRALFEDIYVPIDPDSSELRSPHVQKPPACATPDTRAAEFQGSSLSRASA